MVYLDTPIFGFVISIIAFQIGLFINKKTKKAIFNPLIIAIGLIIILLTYLNIDYEVYNKGGSIITFFLGPATVVLAVPLYKQIERLKSSGISVLLGIIVGCITSIISIFYLSKMFGLTESVSVSLIPKSVTAAISREISAQIGGIPALTVAVTVLTGITGNVIGPYVCKLFGIRDEVAMGIAMGTASHAIGTAKAMELGEVQGAMGSLAISVAGLITVFLTPWLLQILI
ncbi:LrgB family protein [Tissierella sp. MB52-C2]|jgi:predicted murein hydrolase (TIGR00659 family)|uniref:LrgB family protein n=1 Tax=Tissierella sp. MB52-C2 TaxID=3070999 RepID=UPI00280C08B3|nr:LrgB family protein [Tissierella sp. MB52-C2]WMM24519.1 LrgB family protein [Tissierella sp. MB52-C2]